MSLRNLLVTSLVVLAAIPAAAQDGNHGSDIGIAVRAGSLGVGGEISKLLNSHIGLRVGGNYFTFTANGIDIFHHKFTFESQSRAITGLLDLYPSPRGKFHITGGVMSKPISLKKTKQSGGGSFQFNDHTYSAAAVGDISASAEYSSALPYVGIGLGTAASKGKGLAFVLDLGIAIGKAKMSLSSTGSATNTALQNDMNAEIADKQDTANKIPGFPVLAIGFMFKF
jgi:hypothetical protein